MLAVVTIVIASVIILLILLLRLRKKSPMNVEISLNTETGLKSETTVYLSILNGSTNTITLSTHGFILPNKERFVFRHHPRSVTFPVELAIKEKCRVWISARELARELKQRGFAGKVRIVGFFTDKNSITYRSKPYAFDTDYWAKLTFLFR